MSISADYYDFTTYEMLLKTLNQEERDYIQENNASIEIFLAKRWQTIINSLPANYYAQYASQATVDERNNWFQRYLDYPTKDILQMPEIL